MNPAEALPILYAIIDHAVENQVWLKYIFPRDREVVSRRTQDWLEWLVKMQDGQHALLDTDLDALDRWPLFWQDPIVCERFGLPVDINERPPLRGIWPRIPHTSRQKRSNENEGYLAYRKELYQKALNIGFSHTRIPVKYLPESNDFISKFALEITKKIDHDRGVGECQSSDTLNSATSPATATGTSDTCASDAAQASSSGLVTDLSMASQEKLAETIPTDSLKPVEADTRTSSDPEAVVDDVHDDLVAMLDEVYERRLAQGADGSVNAESTRENFMMTGVLQL